MAPLHTVTIKKIISGGLGLAHLADGLVVMVPDVLPGEQAVVELVEKKRQFALSRLVEISSPSQQRVIPPCPYYANCGGCDVMHMSYAAQLSAKEGILAEHLSALSCTAAFEPILSAEKTTLYRQRVRFQVNKRGLIGFFRRLTNDIIPVDRCMLARPVLNSVFAAIQEFRADIPFLKTCTAFELMENMNAGGVICLFHLTRKPRAMDRSAAEQVASQIAEVQSVLFSTPEQGLFGPFQAEERQPTAQGGIDLCYSLKGMQGRNLFLHHEAGGFCQVHMDQNQKLVETMLDWAEMTPETRVLDLFCGLGNFSVPAGLYGRCVVGVDLQRSAIRSAKRNAENNGLNNCTFRQKSALQGAMECSEKGEQFDLVLLDPPRAGCKEIIPYLGTLAPNLIMISCNPATLARDLFLLQQTGFEIQRLRGIDMFPQTHHIETIVQLVHRER